MRDLDPVDAQRVVDGWCSCGHDPGHHVSGEPLHCAHGCACGPPEPALVEEARALLRRRAVERMREMVRAALPIMTPEERVEFFRWVVEDYCRYCGWGTCGGECEDDS